MPRTPGKRYWLVPAVLIGCGLAVCGWQWEEHVRFKRNAREALIKRGRDITSTLGVVLHSERRFGPVVTKERIQAALQDLIEPEDLESIAIYSVGGDALVGAGEPIEATGGVLRTRSEYWGEHTLMMMNLVDIGSGGTDEAEGTPSAVVLSQQERESLRPPSNFRRGGTANANANTGGGTGNPADAAVPAAPAPPPSATQPGVTPAPRPPLGRPPWISQEQFDALMKQNGAHSFVIAMSTDEMKSTVRSDLLLRSLVSFLALGGAIISTLAWNNGRKNAELQIGLVKAGEMNAHLKQMNLAAAGLAHETRNPLNLIRGLAQMIAMQPENPPALKEKAGRITEEADRVTVQLNEFINYSKPRDAHLAPVDVKRLVADVARTLAPDFEEKQIQLQQPDASLTIDADEPLLRQAVFNVLLNASQAVGPKGRIEVRLRQAGPREAILEVADDGPGVPAAERENIFKPYVTMRPNGVGLGLAIVRQIASAHRWDVACLANEPRGAVFRFSRIRTSSS